MRVTFCEYLVLYEFKRNLHITHDKYLELLAHADCLQRNVAPIFYVSLNVILSCITLRGTRETDALHLSIDSLPV